MLAALAVGFGVVCILSLLYPGSSGEWAGLAVMFSAIVAVPLGLLGLVVAGVARSATSRQRKVCAITSAVALLMPVVASVIWNNHIMLQRR